MKPKGSYGGSKFVPWQQMPSLRGTSLAKRVLSHGGQRKSSRETRSQGHPLLELVNLHNSALIRPLEELLL